MSWIALDLLGFAIQVDPSTIQYNPMLIQKSTKHERLGDRCHHERLGDRYHHERLGDRYHDMLVCIVDFAADNGPKPRIPASWQ